MSSDTSWKHLAQIYPAWACHFVCHTGNPQPTDPTRALPMDSVGDFCPQTTCIVPLQNLKYRYIIKCTSQWFRKFLAAMSYLCLKRDVHLITAFSGIALFTNTALLLGEQGYDPGYIKPKRQCIWVTSLCCNILNHKIASSRHLCGGPAWHYELCKLLQVTNTTNTHWIVIILKQCTAQCRNHEQHSSKKPCKKLGGQSKFGGGPDTLYPQWLRRCTRPPPDALSLTFTQTSRSYCRIKHRCCHALLDNLHIHQLAD